LAVTQIRQEERFVFIFHLKGVSLEWRLNAAGIKEEYPSIKGGIFATGKRL